MSFIPKVFGSLHVPTVFLCNVPLTWVKCHKYLGCFIDETLADDIDLIRQTHAIYARGNILIRNFSSCSFEVKRQLFKSFCSNLYGAQLWGHYKGCSYRKLNTAYNNVFRILMNIVRGTSISRCFMYGDVLSFKPLNRKCISGFYKRIMDSDNVLLRTMVSSAYFVYKSPLFNHWKKFLFIL